MKAKIKLFELDPLGNTRRFASQLFVNRKVADFILENGKMLVWKSSRWEEYNDGYEISKTKHFLQPL